MSVLKLFTCSKPLHVAKFPSRGWGARQPRTLSSPTAALIAKRAKIRKSCAASVYSCTRALAQVWICLNNKELARNRCHQFQIHDGLIQGEVAIFLHVPVSLGPNFPGTASGGLPLVPHSELSNLLLVIAETLPWGPQPWGKILPMPFKGVQNIGTSRVWRIMLSSDLHGCQRHWLDHGLAVKNTPNTRSTRWKLPGMLWLGWVMQMPNMTVVPMDRQSQTASWSDGSLCHGCTALSKCCSSDFEPALCKMTTWWHHVALIWTTIDLLCNQYQLRKNKKGTMQLSTQDGKVKNVWGLDCQSFPFHSYAVPIGLFFMLHSLIFISFPFMSAVSKNDW